jgi:hypothetical protein
MPVPTKAYLLVTDSHSDNVVFRFDALSGKPEKPILIVPAIGESADWMPYGLAVDQYGTPYVSIRNKGRIACYRPKTDMFTTFTASPEGGGFGLIYKASRGPQGEFSSRFYLCTREGVRAFTGTKGIDLGYFVSPKSGGLGTTVVSTFGPDGNFYVGEYSGRVLRYHGTSGTFVDIFVAAGTYGFQLVDGLTFGPDGHLYLVSSEHYKVLRYSGTTGALMDEFIPYLPFPSGLRFGPDGNLYVCCGDRIKRYSPAGAFIDDFVKPGGGLYLCNDLEFVTLPIPSLPTFPEWREVPRWMQVIGLAFVIGLITAVLFRPLRETNRLRF